MISLNRSNADVVMLKQCLIDESSAIVESMTCPACGLPISARPMGNSLRPRILTKYHNEGGLQNNLDISQHIIEEAFLTDNPSARAARAFVLLCEEGDFEGVLDLLTTLHEESTQDAMSAQDVVRWQDPLNGGKTGLHVAVEKGKMEVVWLLLWMASNLEEARFPTEFRQAVAVLNLGRELQDGTDVRLTKDEQERTANDLAREEGEVLSALLHSGVLGI